MKGKLKTFRTQSLFNFGFHVDLALCFNVIKFTVFKDRNVLARVAFLTPVRELGCKSLKARHLTTIPGYSNVNTRADI